MLHKTFNITHKMSLKEIILLHVVNQPSFNKIFLLFLFCSSGNIIPPITYNGFVAKVEFLANQRKKENNSGKRRNNNRDKSGKRRKQKGNKNKYNNNRDASSSYNKCKYGYIPTIPTSVCSISIVHYLYSQVQLQVFHKLAHMIPNTKCINYFLCIQLACAYFLTFFVCL